MILSNVLLCASLQDNHLTGKKRQYIKLFFYNTHDLKKVKRDIQPRVRRNMDEINRGSIYNDMLTDHLTSNHASGEHWRRGGTSAPSSSIDEVLAKIVDIRYGYLCIIEFALVPQRARCAVSCTRRH